LNGLAEVHPEPLGEVGYPIVPRQQKSNQPVKRKSLLDPYIGNIEAWLSEDIAFTGTWIYDRLTNMDSEAAMRS